MRLRRFLVALVGSTAVASGAPASVVAGPVPEAPACPLFPADNVWHADVSTLPVHPQGAAWMASMGGPTVRLHPDFGPSDTAQPYGIPYTTVAGDHRKVDVAFDYADESDPGPYPFGPETPIEGGSDRHALIVDRDACRLYELFDARYADGGSTAGSGAVYDLRSNGLRPAGWTSADAAGLPILAGLVRKDEVAAGVVDHAIRMTASRTDRRYLWPARHQAGAADDPTLPPMGAWFRLRASFDVSGFRPDTRVILRAMQRHGMVLADNGSNWYFTGASEPGWEPAMLDELKSVTAAEFEAVDVSSLMVDPDSAQVKGAAVAPPSAAQTGTPAPTTQPAAPRSTTRRTMPPKAAATTAVTQSPTTAPPPAGLAVPAGTAMSDERSAMSTDVPAVGSRLRVRRETPIALVGLALWLAVVGAWIGYFCVLAGRSAPD